MNEFELIQTYFTSLASKGAGEGVVLGIGDDCAILQPPQHSQLVVSTDTLISGVHFPDKTSPADIGYKALAVNLSDLAAMGASPLWFTLCITLPKVDSFWIESFCDGMAELVQATGIHLVGGDTTRGPLSISVHVTGAVPSGRALTRSGALVGDDIYVSGEIGHGAAGLALALAESAMPSDECLQKALLRFNRPQPRLLIGEQLRGIANSCIDISDGLLSDLRHILTASGVGATLDLSALPLSSAVMCSRLFEEKTVQEKQALACNAGDDYELCFTAHVTQRENIAALASQCALPLTRFGSVTERKVVIDQHSAEELPINGYQHF